MVKRDSAQILLGLLLVLVLLVYIPSMRGQSGETGYDLVAAVNNYRISQGMPALTIDAALMAAAQGHAEWMAANHRPSHTGANGSMPGDRAAAAGYSGGSNVRENVAGGTLNYADVNFAVYRIWEQSYGHRLTMLMDALHIGGGTAWDGENQYFVLLIGSPSAEASRAINATMIAVQANDTPPHDGLSSADSTSDNNVSTSGTSVPTLVYVAPVVQATPDGEGTIIHTVQFGQTAWTIAAVYGVNLDEMLAINGLQRPVVLFPGDEIIVQLGPDVTPPAPVLRTHVVREGESAWTIAATYRLTLDQLLEINHLERPVILHPGDELIVQMPLAEATPTPTPEASS